MQSQRLHYKAQRELSGTFSETLSCSKQGVDTLNSFLLDSSAVPELQEWRFQRFPRSSVALFYIVWNFFLTLNINNSCHWWTREQLIIWCSFTCLLSPVSLVLPRWKKVVSLNLLSWFILLFSSCSFMWISCFSLPVSNKCWG